MMQCDTYVVVRLSMSTELPLYLRGHHGLTDKTSQGLDPWLHHSHGYPLRLIVQCFKIQDMTVL